MSNRLSAQKSRTKKLQYVTEMERKVKALEVTWPLDYIYIYKHIFKIINFLYTPRSSIFRPFVYMQAQISVLSPQVALYKNHQRFLQLEQKSLSQQMSVYTNNKILRDGD